MRSGLGARLLEEGDVEGFGRLVTLHHDGDRVARLRAVEMVPEHKDYSDAAMDRLIAGAGAGEDSIVWSQTGAYNVSVPEVDMLVDLALEIEGAAGAGVVGAGLGGCMVVLVREDAADKVIKHLADGYYEPRGLPVAAEIVAPVEGAGVIDV